MRPTTIRNGITATAIGAALVHLVWPNLKIDGITLTLFGIALLPWLAPLFKSLELPGGWKVEFNELKQATDRAEAVGLLAKDGAIAPDRDFSFQTVADTDPNLALAGLRIEIEKRLLELAESKGVSVSRGGLGNLLRELNSRQLINGTESSVLSDLAGLLNSAVHGATVEPAAADWALQAGPRILRALDDRIAASRVRYQGIP